MKNLLRFLTVMFAVIPLSVLLCNLIEASDILDLPKDSFLAFEHFTIGLSWLIIFEIIAFLLTILLILVEKKKKRSSKHLLVASVFYLISILLFFIFILPVNISTEGWTVLPLEWYDQRLHLEYATAIRAVFSFTGFSLIVLALLQNRNYYRVYE